MLQHAAERHSPWGWCLFTFHIAYMRWHVPSVKLMRFCGCVSIVAVLESGSSDAAEIETRRQLLHATRWPLINTIRARTLRAADTNTAEFQHDRRWLCIACSAMGRPSVTAALHACNWNLSLRPRLCMQMIPATARFIIKATSIRKRLHTLCGRVNVFRSTVWHRLQEQCTARLIHRGQRAI